MKVIDSAVDQSSTVYSEAFEHSGGLIDFEIDGTPSGATATLMFAQKNNAVGAAASYSAAHADAALAAAGNWQGSLPRGWVCVEIAGGDGSTALNAYINTVDQDSIGLGPTLTTPA